MTILEQELKKIKNKTLHILEGNPTFAPAMIAPTIKSKSDGYRVAIGSGWGGYCKDKDVGLGLTLTFVIGAKVITSVGDEFGSFTIT